jgi:lipocalin
MFHKNNTAIFSCYTNYSDVMSVSNDYYILSTTQDYNNILVLDNTNDFHDIYVLSRDKSISHKIYMEFENILEELGYNTILQTLDTKC